MLDTWGQGTGMLVITAVSEVDAAPRKSKLTVLCTCQQIINSIQIILVEKCLIHE
jgi:hypothetical protein